MGTKLLLGFGGTVIQVVVHPAPLALAPGVGFGGTVIQVVVHLDFHFSFMVSVSEVR